MSEVSQFFLIINEQVDHVRNLIKGPEDITHIGPGVGYRMPEPEKVSC